MQLLVILYMMVTETKLSQQAGAEQSQAEPQLGLGFRLVRKDAVNK